MEMSSQKHTNQCSGSADKICILQKGCKRLDKVGPMHVDKPTIDNRTDIK